MPRALIITTAGINCDLELSRAFQLAGAVPQSIHLNQLRVHPSLMDDFDLIGLPGGFSYGDAIAAGRIAAQLMRQALYPAFVRAIERGTPIIAPCNGFQMAVQLGLLPGPAEQEPWPAEPPTPTIALATNDTARFIDRWCRVAIPADTRCIWTRGLPIEADTGFLPIAHGEGRLVPASDAVIDHLTRSGQVALEYAADDNPNGSVANIAGVCDSTGLVFGLMPHPERFTRWNQHPSWTRLEPSSRQAEPLGLQIFRNAVAHIQRRRERDAVPVITGLTGHGLASALASR